MEIMRAPVISTGHVRESTAQAIDNGDIQPSMKGEFGWLFFTGPDQPEVTEELELVLAWARELNFEYVVFDRDAKRVPELEFHDW